MVLGEIGAHLLAEVERGLVQRQAENQLGMGGSERERDGAASGVAVEVEPVKSGAASPAEQSVDLVGDRVVVGRRRERVELELLRIRVDVRAELADQRGAYARRLGNGAASTPMSSIRAT